MQPPIEKQGQDCRFSLRADSDLDSEFATHLVERFSDPIYEIEGVPLPKHWAFRCLNGQNVCDLGGSYGRFGEIARISGASSYTCVDAFNTENTESIISPNGFSWRSVKADMLTFLRDIPAQSVSLFLGGIDAAILRDELKRMVIADEIARVLHPLGVALYYRSVDDLIPPGLTSEWLTMGSDMLRVAYRNSNPMVHSALPSSGWWSTLTQPLRRAWTK